MADPSSAEPDGAAASHPLTGALAHGEENFRHRFADAALRAERMTGRHEKSDEEARRGLLIRYARIVGGFVLVFAGLAALPLPGPGWLIILIGLSLLPYAWAERTVRLIRRRIPGIPEEGAIPRSSLVVMGLSVAAFATVSIVWGPDIREAIVGLF